MPWQTFFTIPHTCFKKRQLAISETAQENTFLPVIPVVIDVIQLLCDEDTEIALKRILNRITQHRNGYVGI